MKNFDLENENGRSMIEMLGVLAIIGVLSVGGIAGYSKAMQKYRINKAIEQITLIAGNVHSFFAPQKNYVGISNDTILLKAKLVPEEMWEYNTDNSFKQFTNVFGERVLLSIANKSKSGDNQAFVLNYGLSKKEEVCIELLSQDWTDAGVKEIAMTVPPIHNKTPISIETAVSMCTAFVSANCSNCGILLLFDANDNCSFNTGGSTTCS